MNPSGMNWIYLRAPPLTCPNNLGFPSPKTVASLPETWTWCVRQPFCDESGVGFAAHLAENSTPLWSHHSILRSDETWLPERSGNLGGVQRWRSSVAWDVLGQASLPGHLNEKYSCPEVWRGGGCNFSATERAHKRNGGQVDAEWRRRSLVTMKRRFDRRGFQPTRKRKRFLQTGDYSWSFCVVVNRMC